MIRYASQALFHITRLSTTNRRKVINVQTGPVFLTTLYRC